MNDLDHRVLGNRLDLFHQQEEGLGMVFWHPRGWELYRVLEDYIRQRMRRAYPGTLPLSYGKTKSTEHDAKKTSHSAYSFYEPEATA